MVVELSVVHAGLECPKHARLATSQGIKHANRDDPHCSAAGTAALSSPDEALCCPLVALRGVLERKTEQPAVAFIDVALACQSSVKHKQLRTGTNRYATPYHKTSPSIPVMFNNGAVRVPLTSATPNATSSVKIFSRNRDSSVKSTVVHCWLVHRRCCLVQPGLSMSLGKLHPNVRSPSSKSSAVKSILHGLNRHSCYYYNIII